MKQLVFDTTDANTIADSDNVGAYVRSSDGTLVTSTTDGGKERLDVSTELGLAEDGAHVSGELGVLGLAVRSDAGGSLVDTDGDRTPLSIDDSGNLRVAATVNVDAGSQYAEDSQHTNGDDGEFVLSIRMADIDGANSAILAGSEGDYQGVFTNNKGEMYVTDKDSATLLTSIDSDTSTIAALSKIEDSVHSSGDTGVMGLAVRNDAGTPLAADGDYIPLTVNDQGSLYAHLTGSDPLTINDAALADTAIAAAANPLTASNTAEDVVIAPLASRKYLFIYNNGNRTAYVGQSGVSAATGFPVDSGSTLELRAGASVDIEWVSANTSQEIRTLELS